MSNLLFSLGYLDMSPSRRASRLEGEDIEGYLRPTFPHPGSHALRHSEAPRQIPAVPHHFFKYSCANKLTVQTFLYPLFFEVVEVFGRRSRGAEPKPERGYLAPTGAVTWYQPA